MWLRVDDSTITAEFSGSNAFFQTPCCLALRSGTRIHDSQLWSDRAQTPPSYLCLRSWSYHGPQLPLAPPLAESTSYLPMLPVVQNGCRKHNPRTCSNHALVNGTSPSASSAYSRSMWLSVLNSCAVVDCGCLEVTASACTASQILTRAFR